MKMNFKFAPDYCCISLKTKMLAIAAFFSSMFVFSPFFWDFKDNLLFLTFKKYQCSD